MRTIRGLGGLGLLAIAVSGCAGAQARQNPGLPGGSAAAPAGWTPPPISSPRPTDPFAPRGGLGEGAGPFASTGMGLERSGGPDHPAPLQRPDPALRHGGAALLASTGARPRASAPLPEAVETHEPPPERESTGDSDLIPALPVALVVEVCPDDEPAAVPTEAPERLAAADLPPVARYFQEQEVPPTSGFASLRILKDEATRQAQAEVVVDEPPSPLPLVPAAPAVAEAQADEPPPSVQPLPQPAEPRAQAASPLEPVVRRPARPASISTSAGRPQMAPRPPRFVRREPPAPAREREAQPLPAPAEADHTTDATTSSPPTPARPEAVAEALPPAAEASGTSAVAEPPAAPRLSPRGALRGPATRRPVARRSAPAEPPSSPPVPDVLHGMIFPPSYYGTLEARAAATAAASPPPSSSPRRPAWPRLFGRWRQTRDPNLQPAAATAPVSTGSSTSLPPSTVPPAPSAISTWSQPRNVAEGG